MSRDAETRGSGPTIGTRPVPGLPALYLWVFAGIVVLAVIACGDATATMTFETPDPDTNVHQVVDLVVDAGVNITNVSFYYRSTGDYILIGEGNLTPPSFFGIQWETRMMVDGEYEILANGTIDTGGYETANVTGIHVDNTKPNIAFVKPRDDMRVNGIYMITLVADDEATAVELYIDKGISGFMFMGNALRVNGTSNWTYPWDTTDFDEKEGMGFLAIAYDAANNDGRSTVLGIDVDNVVPDARLIFPETNATLDGYVRLLGNTTEEHMLEANFDWRVSNGTWFSVGHANWNDTLGNYTYFWNTFETGEYDGVEVRFVVMDDLGQRGVSMARNITLVDLPPVPVFLAPGVGDHLTGVVELTAMSSNDTRSMYFEYLSGEIWVKIGDAKEAGECTWCYTWDTSSYNIYETTIRVIATDSSGSGEAFLASIQVDNRPPVPRITQPTESQYRILDYIVLIAIADRDCEALSFYYEDGNEWVLIDEAMYDPDIDLWVLEWFIPSELYLEDSALCATAVDEVDLIGSSPLLANRVIGKKPFDDPPEFKLSMPEVIYINEDNEYILYLSDHVTDDSPSTLKFYVTGEPTELFTVYGENTVGRMDLRFITVPNKYGEADVIIFVEDPSGQFDQADLKVVVTSVPDAPIFTSVPPNLFLHPGIPYEFDYGPYVSDSDSAIEDLSILQPDDNRVSRDPDDPLVLLFLSNNKLGTTFYVDVWVVDETSLTVNRSIMITVTDDWVPELRRPLPDIFMTEDEALEPAFNLDEFFHDPDHDALYYSYGNQHVNVVIGNEYPHMVSIIPPLDWHGTDTITFRANDPTGALLEDTIIVHCNSTNDPPMILPYPDLPRLIIHDNASFEFDLSPYIQDVDHELADLTLQTNDPFATRSDVYTLGLRLTYPYKKKALDIQVTITDPEGGAVTLVVSAVVGDNYPPNMVYPPPDVVINEGLIEFSVFNITSAFDPGLEPPGTWKELTFEFLCRQAIFIVNPVTGWVDVRMEDPDFNTYNGTHNNPIIVLMRVKDAGGALREFTFKLTVLPVNDPPEVGQIQDLVITDGITTIDLRNYIRDVDTLFSSFEFEVMDGNRPGQTISQISVYGTLLVLDYRGSPSRKDTVNLWIIDNENRVMMKEFKVKVEAPEAEDSGISVWMIVVVAIATGGIAIYASKFVWGRFEPPSVQDVFLVYGDGVIIRHVSKRGAIGMDEDLAIAMLTAIQEFVQQSMRSAQLKSMQAGENNILIERDPDRLFYIAVIHTGTVSEELRKAINNTTRSIKDNYGDVLRKWNGNIALFDGVENCLNDILVISHAHIPEGVRFEMEGITSIEPGKTFLFQGKDVVRTHNIFRGLLEEQGSGLLISRVHPQRLHPSIPDAGAECVWLSKTPTKRGVSPSNTTMILHEITTFIREHKRTVVCLDGLEYLLVQNPLDEVVGFVEELQDMVQMDDFIMMIHVDPYSLDDSSLSRLSRNMVPVSDRNNNDSR
jgi:hypothetical protein